MSINNAKSTLKVLGILSIIGGVLGIILGITLFAGGSLLPADMIASGEMGGANTDTALAITGAVMFLGIFTVVSGVIDLLLGIFSVRASSDFSKIGPAYTLALISLILSVIVLALNFMSAPNFTTLLDGIGGLVFGACIFWAAKTIKEQN